MTERKSQFPEFERLSEEPAESASENQEVRILNSKDYIKKMREAGYEELAATYEKVVEICEAVKEAGGRALLVGGSVRDMLAGKISKDYDLEVYGVKPEDLESLVGKHGRVSEVGKAFGILKVSAGEGIDIDVSIPRSDSKVAEGHRGFAVKTDPFMSIEDAARRRDFTINSMSADPITCEIFDPFGGVMDLRNRCLRVTDEERFKDDPLRVMRALQFIGRFGLELDEDSARIIREMAPQLKELPKERIGEEWKKLLLKSPKPSLGLAAGMGLGVFHELHVELPPLVETKQDPEWHPEGDAWVHTMMAVDYAAKIARREKLGDDQAWILMLATLAHDIGKPKVTEFVDGKWRSLGHEEAGTEPTKKFLAKLGVEGEVRDKVVKLVVEHLAPVFLYAEEKVRGHQVSDGSIRRLANRLFPATISELVMVSEADIMGRGPFADPEIPEQLLLPEGFPAGPWLLERARKVNVDKSKPARLISGKDLVVFGFKENPKMGVLIKLADQLRDEKNYTAPMVFAAIDGIKDYDAAIEKLRELLK